MLNNWMSRSLSWRQSSIVGTFSAVGLRPKPCKISLKVCPSCLKLLFFLRSLFGHQLVKRCKVRSLGFCKIFLDLSIDSCIEKDEREQTEGPKAAELMSNK